MARFSNVAVITSLTSSLSGAGNETTLNVGSTTGWPTPATGEKAKGVIAKATNNKTLFSYTGLTGTTFTGVVLGIDGTVGAYAHLSGASVEHVISGADVEAATGSIPLATFSRSGVLTTATGQNRFMIRGGSWIITQVVATVGTAPTGASLIVDVNKNGTTIFTTQGNRPTIAVSTFSHTVTNINTVDFAPSDDIRVDIDQVGSTVAGSDLTVIVWARPAV